MFRPGFRKCVQLFLPYSKICHPQGQAVNTKTNPGYTTILRNVSFFNKGNFESLLKSVISVSPAGRKRGRGKEKSRKILNNPNKGQKIGYGEANILWPGLNTNIMEARSVVELKSDSPDPEFHEKLALNRSKILKKRIPAVHDLERGWAGRSICGKKSPPPESLGEKYQGFTMVPLEFRVRNVMTSHFGKCKRTSVFLAVGNNKGALGIALGRGVDLKTALEKGFKRAVSKLYYYQMEDKHTINHDFYFKFGYVKLFAYRRPEGFGLICHRAIAECCKLMGIKNLYAKVEGSTNTRYVVKAFLLGLFEQKSFQEIANESGYHVVEFRKDQMNFPRLLASPTQGAHKEHNNMLYQEFVMGNLPLVRKKEPNICIQFERHFKKTHFRRNMEDVKIRIKAKHGKLISHLTDIYPECERMM